MTEQLILDMRDSRIGGSRKRDPRTSVEAARTCDAQRQRDVLLRELNAAFHGRTCDELEAATGIPRYIIASRLAQMRRDGWCEPFGVRQNERGRSAQVWYVSRVVTVPVSEGRL